MSQFTFSEILRLGVIAGIVGTAGMTIVLNIITKSKWANADMVRAIGSIFTKKLESAFVVGLIVHFAVGIIIGILYAVALASFNLNTFVDVTAAGIIISVFHGFVVSLLLVVSVAEHHPVSQFRQAGFSVAAAHLAAHIVYGLLVGLTIAILI